MPHSFRSCLSRKTKKRTNEIKERRACNREEGGGHKKNEAYLSDCSLGADSRERSDSRPYSFLMASYSGCWSLSTRAGWLHSLRRYCRAWKMCVVLPLLSAVALAAATSSLAIVAMLLAMPCLTCVLEKSS